MKATIRFADGKTIEAEGTPEEIAKFAGSVTEASHTCPPCLLQHWPPYGYQPIPWLQPAPVIPYSPWGVGIICGDTTATAYQQNAPNPGGAFTVVGGLGGSGGNA